MSRREDRIATYLVWAVGTDGRAETSAYVSGLTEHLWQVSDIGGLAVAVAVCGRAWERYECYLLRGTEGHRCKVCLRREAAIERQLEETSKKDPVPEAGKGEA